MGKKEEEEEKLTSKSAINRGTILSFTKATTQPPHPAPVSLAPSAPFSRQVFTSSSNSGQLIKGKYEVISTDN